MAQPTFDPTQIRILGTLIEKALTVPDNYPLTLNALVSGCNQKSNRDPAMELAGYQVEGALRALFVDGWAGQHTREGGRVTRWNERLRERLALDRPAAAVLAELMLRGPQPVGGLRGHASRMAPLASIDEANAVLAGLRDAELVELLPRRPGERAPRWTHRIERPAPEEDAADDVATETAPAPSPPRTTPLFPLPADPPRVVPKDPAPPRAPRPVVVAAPAEERPHDPPPSVAPAATTPSISSDDLAELRAELRRLREDLDALRRIVDGPSGLGDG